MPDGPTWISARKALAQVETYLGSRTEAKRLLAEHLRDGGLRSFAKETWTSSSLRVPESFKDPLKRNHKLNVVLPPSVYRRSEKWGADLDDWRWPSSNFCITRYTPRLRRNLLWRVRFAQEDVDRILMRKKPAPGGRPREEEAWTAMWHALIGMAQKNQLTFETFPSMEKLYREVLEEVGEGLSLSSVRGPLKQVYKKFVQPRA